MTFSAACAATPAALRLAAVTDAASLAAWKNGFVSRAITARYNKKDSA